MIIYYTFTIFFFFLNDKIKAFVSLRTSNSSLLQPLYVLYVKKRLHFSFYKNISQ